MPVLSAAWFAAGVAWWTLLEYLLHRFAFHGGAAGLGARHRAHHADVRSRDLALASPPAVALGLGAHALVFLGVLGAAPGGAALAGVAAGYAGYEALHLAAHRPRPRARWLRRLRRHHLLHHGAPDAGFGVTTTLWDRVFGTLPGSPRVPGLTRRQARVTLAVAEALLAGRSGPPAGPRLAEAVRGVGAFLRRAGTQTRAAVRVALWVVQLSPLLYFGRLRRFTGAPLALRAACLERIERGRLGILAVALKLSVSFAFFEQPESLAELGYRGPGLPRAAPADPAPARAASMAAPEERP